MPPNMREQTQTSISFTRKGASRNGSSFFMYFNAIHDTANSSAGTGNARPLSYAIPQSQYPTNGPRKIAR